MINGWVVKLKYTEVVADHYKYIGELYDHNALRHDGRTNSQIGL